MDWNKVYLGDCDIILPEFETNGTRFDLILTDPPYNLNKNFGNDSDQMPLPEYLSTMRKRIEICSRLLTHQGSIVWFGIHHYIGFIQVMMYEAGLFYRRMNIWHYENGFSRSKKAPATQYEPFLWFSKSNKQWTYNADDVRIPYKSVDRLKNPVYYNSKNGERKAWLPNPGGSLRGDVWSFPTLAGKRFAAERTDHPTQKPEALMLELIKAYCPKGDDGKYDGTILDPFIGSGTLGVCCEKLNKQGHRIRWIGIEIEQHWYDVANHRIQQAKDMEENKILS